MTLAKKLQGVFGREWAAGEDDILRIECSLAADQLGVLAGQNPRVKRQPATASLGDIGLQVLRSDGEQNWLGEGGSGAGGLFVVTGEVQMLIAGQIAGRTQPSQVGYAGLAGGSSGSLMGLHGERMGRIDEGGNRVLAYQRRQLIAIEASTPEANAGQILRGQRDLGRHGDEHGVSGLRQCAGNRDGFAGATHQEDQSL